MHATDWYKFWRPSPTFPLIPVTDFGDAARLQEFMYWKNEVLSPLSEGNKILSEGIPTKQVPTRWRRLRIQLCAVKGSDWTCAQSGPLLFALNRLNVPVLTSHVRFNAAVTSFLWNNSDFFIYFLVFLTKNQIPTHADYQQQPAAASCVTCVSSLCDVTRITACVLRSAARAFLLWMAWFAVREPLERHQFAWRELDFNYSH